MGKIKHIVYLMLENRSFDQLLGWLYDEQNPPKINIPTQSPPTFNGLKENTYFNKDKDGRKHFVVKGTNNNMNVPVHDPHEEYSHVNNQVFESETNPVSPQKPTMGGFYKDFAMYKSYPEQIMQTYTPEELPVINGLARNFAVSDNYHCSIPTQTNCNRAFAACGNSLGINHKGQLEAWVNNRDFSYFPTHLGQPVGKQFNQKTMWNVLSDNGKNKSTDWMHYFSKGSKLEDWLGLEGYAYTRDLMTQLQDKSFDQHFDSMDTFFERAKTGTLPSVCFLEPEWGLESLLFGKDIGVEGNDYHPPTNLVPGEKLLKDIYDALTSNKAAWEQTLWIINFDEHGGTYDHVLPAWNATPPWASDGTPKPDVSELGFGFDRFGVRVPLILVSPLVQKSTVFRAEGSTPYDHTSVIATILKMMEIPKEKWGLGGRTANAPTFENVFEGNPVRKDIPNIEINTSGKTLPEVETNVPPNDIHLRIVHNLVDHAIRHKGLSRESVKKLSLPVLRTAKTKTEISGMLKIALEKIKNHKEDKSWF